ncbi:MAG: cytochrome c biogenesis protein CcsA [Deltaproteobacteria bacterium]|nr:cytochrome c biogenesis protein CcsA [Deltaproteobacteria bacterium]
MKRNLLLFEIALFLSVLAVSLYMIFYYAPVEKQMGIVQKIFYFHVPSAYSMYLGWILCTVSSVLYITQKKEKFDIMAKSSARVAFVFAVLVMITGPLWGRKAWGSYWVWDPRLTSALLLTLIIASYLILRAGEKEEAIKKFSAVLAVIGLAIIPIIHISVLKWRGQHPHLLKKGGLEHSMLITFVVSMAAFTAVFIILVHQTYLMEKRIRALKLKKQNLLLNGTNDEGHN